MTACSYCHAAIEVATHKLRADGAEKSRDRAWADNDGLHRRIDALVAIAEAAEELCRAVGERAADGDFNPLPQASLTGAVREEIAPHVFRQWAAVKAALHRAEMGSQKI